MEFSDIAFAKFLQTAPELSSSIVAFKDVSEDLTDESDINVGIFILKSGSDILYVPVVSKGDGVYPIDSVFINSKNKFFPLTKNTVERIINSQREAMGTSKKIPNTVDQNPSVYHLVNPPKTGKFAYASASRMVDFLSSIPNDLKGQVLEKFSADSEVYNKLHKLFGLESLVKALTSNLEPATRPADRSVGTRIITGGDNLPTPQVNAILTKGYAVDGANPLTRVAIASQFWKDGRFTNIGTLEEGYAYDIVMKDGSIRRAYVPKKRTASFFSPNNDGFDNRGSANKPSASFLLFENGDYAIDTDAVMVGDKEDGAASVRNLFNFRPPMLVKNINSGDTFGLFDSALGLIGVFDARSVVITHTGYEIKAYDRIGGKSVVIKALNGYGKSPVDTGSDLYVPTTSVVIPLAQSVSYDVESSPIAASKRREAIEWALLNSSMNLTYDNVEFSINGNPVGPESAVMEILVVKEGIDPNVASSFVKKAEQDKKVIIYLSKKADFEAGSIPQFGGMPPNQVNPLGTQQDYLPMNKVKTGLDVGDSQAVESIVISELLQSPNMEEHVQEYLPDIEEAIDRFGRILFLGRIHINKLGEGNDPDEVFNMLTSLKNVYKMLGDNYIKLEQLVANVGTKA